MPLSDRCSWCGVLIAEHPDTDACAVADEAARADADPLRARVALLEGALADVLILGHIQDDGPSLCQCRIHQNARRALQPPAVTATETWGSHRFQPGASAPDKCLWTDGRWSACKAPGNAWCHTPAVTATGVEGRCAFLRCDGWVRDAGCHRP